MADSQDTRRKYEILAVLITAAGKFIFMDFLQWKFPFIVLSIVGWSGYVFYRSKIESGILAHWGFRTDNFKKVLRMVLPFGIAAVAAFFITGYFLGTLNINWHIIPILLLYPIWGVIQQFLVIGLMAGNLQDLEKQKMSKPVIIFLTALLFGLVHYPYYWLMLGTFALALFYGFIYLKERNVYVMGLFHGWLGGLFFYTVVNRDPFAEVFGKLIN
jgi:membrane protease YdiL (CAAX protease family)